MKPMLYVANVDEDADRPSRCAEIDGVAPDPDLREGRGRAGRARARRGRRVPRGRVGLEEPGLNALIREAYRLLGLQSFFTAGQKEVRAWTVRTGAKAPEAAGVIHTDFERGFIKAEVIGYADFDALGSEAAAKAAGKLRIEGKEYVVQDGDVMHFRFNV